MMKINWKIVAGLVIIVGTIVWAINSINPQAYAGNNLNFAVGSGTVRVTNPTTLPVAVRLVGTTSRPFSVSSSTEGIAGNSVKDGTNRNHVFDFTVPAGVSEFLVARGSNIFFVAQGTVLQVLMNPLTESNARATGLFAIAVVGIVLIYLSFVTEHGWWRLLRGKKPLVADAPVIPVIVSDSQEKKMRSFGDNRAKL